MGRSAKAVKETFLKLEKVAQNIGVKINENKTKYMKITNRLKMMNFLLWINMNLESLKHLDIWAQ